METQHDRDCVRVMGIDPGSRTLGFSITTCFPYEQIFQLDEAWTLITEKVLQLKRFRVDRVGEHQVRLEAIEEEVYQALVHFHPDVVIMETPYLGRLPQSFFVLTQVMTAIGRAVERYSSAMILQKIDPATVKKAIGVPGNSSDKELVRKAVEALQCLDNLSDRTLQSLDEHAIDATAVAHYYCVSELGLEWKKPC